MARSFGSDNHAGVHPEILLALEKANIGDVHSYGDDIYTNRAVEKFKQYFGNDIGVYFAFNGTAANVIGLQSATRSYNSIICAQAAHLNVDECGAPERFAGKVISIPTIDGKLSSYKIEKCKNARGNVHNAQPSIVSISQPTELGTVYRPSEVADLAQFSHDNGFYLHMDGARISNAASHLGLNFADFTRDVGVDVLSFGGTKNGMMYGDAVVVFQEELNKHLPYIQKQSLQLASKMRYISAQFEALLSNDLWLRNARRANDMAQMLYQEIYTNPNVVITQKVESNAVFAAIPRESVQKLQEQYFFYVWDNDWSDTHSEVRLMCSFDTKEDDVKEFARYVNSLI